MKAIPLLLLTIFASTAQLAAQEDDPVLAKMRDALRSTTLQLRDAQGKIAELQASEIASQREIEKLQAEVKKLKEEAIAERNVSANAISELQGKLDKSTAAIAGNLTAIEKWRKEYGEATERAQKAEAARSKADAEIVKLKRLVESQRYQNVKMYRVGMEILERYDNFWFGDALLAREPFVGNTKVKLQNLAQDGQDKLLAARIREGVEPPPPPTSGATEQQTPGSSPTADPNQKEAARQKPQPTNQSAGRGKPDSDGTKWPTAEPM